MVGLESAGLLLPGETAMLAASYLAATGHLALPLAIGEAASGAVMDDSVGYLVGRKGGRRFLEIHGRYAGITPEKRAKAERYFIPPVGQDGVLRAFCGCAAYPCRSTRQGVEHAIRR